MAREKSMIEKWRDWRIDGEPFENRFSETTVITEKKELGGAMINTIDRLTDSNNHNEARLQLAKSFLGKNSPLVQSYEALIVLHNQMNQMNDLMKVREKLDKMLFTGAKRVYSDYEQIQRAF